MATKQKPLTEAQRRALLWLTNRYQAPGNRFVACRALQECGLAEATSVLEGLDPFPDATIYVRVFKLTDAGAELRKTLQEGSE